MRSCYVSLPFLIWVGTFVFPPPPNIFNFNITLSQHNRTIAQPQNHIATTTSRLTQQHLCSSMLCAFRIDRRPTTLGLPIARSHSFKRVVAKLHGDLNFLNSIYIPYSLSYSTPALAAFSVVSYSVSQQDWKQIVSLVSHAFDRL